MDSPHQSVGQRRGQRLAPLDTSLNNHPNNNNVKRQSSKTGLRILFGRDKPSRKSSPDNTLADVDETETHDLDAPLSPSVCTTPRTTASTPTFAASPTTASHLKKPPPRPRGEAGHGGSERNWKPPPLFQAYPQAIKYDCLTAPALSADSILRIHASSAARRNPRDPRAQRQNHEAGDPKKKKDDRKKHLRSLSETIGKADWSSKIYVLATSGYILQYAGDGKHDRLPEKILQLGPKSAAFASDAIPGKHWVLQVSQHPDEDVANAAGSAESHRPLLSRLGFHRSHHRRLARGFLLVFNSPEEMSSWLLAVRAEIEAQGGKKYVTERVFDDGEEDQLRSKPSARQMVKRDPNRFSNVFLQPQLVDPANEQFAQDGQSRRSSYHSLNRRSLVTESRSGSTSTGRTDGPTPTNNMDPSYAAGMNGGLSRPENTASPPPIRSDAAARGLSTPNAARMHTQSPPVSSPKQRQSTFMHSISSSPEGSRGVPPAQPASNPLMRSASPPAPNFSVPSFSRRFATKAAPTPMSHAPRLPPTAVRRNEHDTSAASFPSPPQSPTRSTSSFDRKDSTELHVAQPVRKPLRVSNSDASLGSLAESVHQHRDPRPQPAARTPKPTPTSPPNTATGLVDASSSSSSSSSPSATQPQQQQRSQPPSSGDQQPRSRISSLYQPSALNRRKSMPGLAGPPAAPPPDYPLPKIPSPVTASRPPWPGYTKSPPPLKNAQRISTMHTAGARSVSSARPANGIRE